MLTREQIEEIRSIAESDSIRGRWTSVEGSALVALCNLALRGLNAGEQWQTMESAPKDGTAVLVMRDIWPGTKSGRAEECNGHNTYVAEWWDGPEPAWMCYMDSICEPHCPIEPTHWQPLPAPPAMKEKL